jgi:hypothetical protein
VEIAEDAPVLGLQDAPALRERLGGMVELDPALGTTDAAALDRPPALALVPFPDGPADVGRYVAAGVLRRDGRGRLRRGSLLPRILHEAAAPGLVLEDAVEADLDDRL